MGKPEHIFLVNYGIFLGKKEKLRPPITQPKTLSSPLWHTYSEPPTNEDSPGVRSRSTLSVLFSAQKSTQKSAQRKKHSKNAQISTQKSYIAQKTAQNSVFTQKKRFQQIWFSSKFFFEGVHKYTQGSAQKALQKTFKVKISEKSTQKCCLAQEWAHKSYFLKKNAQQSFFGKKKLS